MKEMAKSLIKRGSRLLDLWISELESLVPWIALVAGLTGSLHCVGMCGGLVTASCHNKNDIFGYQIGRLLSYLALGLLGGSLGKLLNIKSQSFLLTILPSIIIGLIFIYWGIKSYLGMSHIKKTPTILNQSYQKLWKKHVLNNQGKSKAYIVGMLSILLPCGLLYGIVLGTMATQTPTSALIGMFFFWLGTLPAMVFAPKLVQKILNPFKLKKPKIYALCLVLIGLTTIGHRATKQYYSSHNKHQENSCH